MQPHECRCCASMKKEMESLKLIISRHARMLERIDERTTLTRPLEERAQR